MGRSICVHYNYISDEKFVTVTMAVSCAVLEIKRDIGRKTAIFHTHHLPSI